MSTKSEQQDALRQYVAELQARAGIAAPSMHVSMIAASWRRHRAQRPGMKAPAGCAWLDDPRVSERAAEIRDAQRRLRVRQLCGR